MASLNLQDWAHIFNILGVSAAIIVYILNSLANRRQRVIDNAERYLEVHRVLFAPDSYPSVNVAAMEDGTFKRDLSNKEMELKFNRFLCELEHLALLQNAGAVPKAVNAYMIGWFAKHLYPALTDREKAEPYWILAVDFLRETTRQADELDKRGYKDLITFIKRNHFK